MKRICVLFFLISCAFSIASAQSALPGRTTVFYPEILQSSAVISEESASLLRFFEAREGTARTVDAVGLAATVRKLGDRLFDGITLGKCAGSLGKARELSRRLKEISERVYGEELTAFDMEETLFDLPILSLNETQAARVMDAAAALEIQ